MEKSCENTLITLLFRSERITAAAGVTGTFYYNGAPITNASGYGLDTQKYGDVTIGLNLGTVLGETTTLLNSIYESDTDDPSAASLLSGASFTSISTSGDDDLQCAAIHCQNTKRYLFLVTEIQKPSAITPTIDFGAFAVLGNPDTTATDQTLIFDV